MDYAHLQEFLQCDIEAVRSSVSTLFYLAI